MLKRRKAFTRPASPASSSINKSIDQERREAVFGRPISSSESTKQPKAPENELAKMKVRGNMIIVDTDKGGISALPHKVMKLMRQGLYDLYELHATGKKN